jgi:hypothetical protein
VVTLWKVLRFLRSLFREPELVLLVRRQSALLQEAVAELSALDALCAALSERVALLHGECLDWERRAAWARSRAPELAPDADAAVVKYRSLLSGSLAELQAMQLHGSNKREFVDAYTRRRAALMETVRDLGYSEARCTAPAPAPLRVAEPEPALLDEGDAFLAALIDRQRGYSSPVSSSSSA